MNVRSTNQDYNRLKEWLAYNYPGVHRIWIDSEANERMAETLARTIMKPRKRR